MNRKKEKKNSFITVVSPCREYVNVLPAWKMLYYNFTNIMKKKQIKLNYKIKRLIE